jgi:hypothetical protein
LIRDRQTGIDVPRLAVTFTTANVEQSFNRSRSSGLKIECLAERSPQAVTIEVMSLHVIPVKQHIIDFVLEFVRGMRPVALSGLPNYELHRWIIGGWVEVAPAILAGREEWPN